MNLGVSKNLLRLRRAGDQDFAVVLSTREPPAAVLRCANISRLFGNARLFHPGRPVLPLRGRRNTRTQLHTRDGAPHELVSEPVDIREHPLDCRCPSTGGALPLVKLLREFTQLRQALTNPRGGLSPGPPLLIEPPYGIE